MREAFGVHEACFRFRENAKAEASFTHSKRFARQFAHKISRSLATKRVVLALSLLSFALMRSLSNGAEQIVRPWQDYRTIMWIGDSASKKPEKLPLFYQRLREMGINTAMV